MTRLPRVPGRRLVRSPGPTRVPEEVLHALQRPPPDLADACVSRRLHRQGAGVYFHVANGRGGWRVSPASRPPGRPCATTACAIAASNA